MFETELSILINDKKLNESISLTPDSIDNYSIILKKHGWIFNNDFEMNGWQVDFWAYFEHKNYNYKLMLSGSLWHGNWQLTKTKE